MSTVPTVPVTEAVPVLFSQEATQAAGGFDSIKQMMDNFDPAALLPELDSLSGWVVTIARIAVMAGPLVLLVLGIAYLLIAPKEANYSFGYRTYFGMGSVEAWQFTQRVGGTTFVVLGFCLMLAMLVVVSDFSIKDPFEISVAAMKCMLWQIGLVIVARIGVALAAAICFDRFGNRRRERDI